MRLILDTNVILAAVISHGTCHELLERCAQFHVPIWSDFIIAELRRHLIKKFKFSITEVASVIGLFDSQFEHVKIEAPTFKACRDPDDDWILQTALVGIAHCIITGDKDLLDLKCFRNIDIIKPNEFWKYENQSLRTQ